MVHKTKSKDKVYHGYRLINHGYYPPDKHVWWEAEDIATGEGAFHNTTMRALKADIDAESCFGCRHSVSGKPVDAEFGLCNACKRNSREPDCMGDWYEHPAPTKQGI